MWGESLETRRQNEIGWLILHFAFGFFALFLAPLQFISNIRDKYPIYHRTAGKIYVVGAISASLMAFYLLSNYPLKGSIISLGLLDVIWLFTTVVAFLFARQKNFRLHRQFMTRSYLCALAFVYLRFFDKLNSITGALNFIADEDTREVVIDSMWIFLFLITEFFIQWYPNLKKLTLVKRTLNLETYSSFDETNNSSAGNSTSD